MPRLGFIIFSRWRPPHCLKINQKAPPYGFMRPNSSSCVRVALWINAPFGLLDLNWRKGLKAVVAQKYSLRALTCCQVPSIWGGKHHILLKGVLLFSQRRHTKKVSKPRRSCTAGQSLFRAERISYFANSMSCDADGQL